MPQFKWDKDTGIRYYVDEDGTATPAPDTNLRIPFTDVEFNALPEVEAALINTGEKLHDFGRGIRGIFADDEQRQVLQQEGLQSDAELAGLRGEFPISSAIGGALPSLATAPLSAPGLLGSLGLQGALGAAEGFIDFDPSDSSNAGNAAVGSAAGILGDLGGRMAGRVVNAIGGIVADFSKLGRGAAENPAAQVFEDLGGATLAHQRLAQGSPAQRLAERAAQGAESSFNPPAAIRAARDVNDELFRDTSIKAVGLDPANYDNLGPDFIDDALEFTGDGFERVTKEAGKAGQFQLPADQAEMITGIGQVSALRKTGLFKGLDDGVLTGKEWVIARRALAEDAATNSAKGWGTMADRIHQVIGDLDTQMEARLPKEFLPEFARLREQYRVLSILEAPNVINGTGNINVRTLNNRLRGKGSGFGRTATRGADTVNPESKDLIDLMRAADRPEFKAFRSSGTAENQALARELTAGTEAVGGILQGNPAPAAGFIARQLAPGVIGASETGGGRLFQGLVNPAPAAAGQLGGAAGRGFLDEALFPFVGAQDDRPRQ